MLFKNVVFVAKTCKYGIFVAKIYKYALIDSFQGSAGSLDSAASCAALFLSEIIELQENGGGGGNLTQILYFPFYMGIAP